ncbi:hypothetical protein [Stenotrophomonas maltophilia]|uniref:hypothetical protein n=1 Tax=Stenotrophomonas maltophilia TaxID=40324 RepID=UPI0039C3AA18
MAMQNKCVDVTTFRAPVARKERTEKLATSAEAIAQALYRKPSQNFSMQSALTAFAGVRSRRS